MKWNNKLSILNEKINREYYNTISNHKIHFTKNKIRTKRQSANNSESSEGDVESALRDREKPPVRHFLFLGILEYLTKLNILLFPTMLQNNVLFFYSLHATISNMLVRLVLNGMGITFSRYLCNNWSIKQMK